MRRGLAVSAATLATALFAAPGAPAADIQAGDRCTGDLLETGRTLLVKQNREPYSELPPVVPDQSEPEAITAWTVRAAADAPTSTQKLVIYALAANGEARKLAESAPRTVSPGVNRFTTDLRVPEFARIGLWGPDGSLACEAEQHRALALDGDPAEGETVPLSGGPEDTGVPVVVTIDGNGGEDPAGGQEGETDRNRLCPVAGAGSDACSRLGLWGRTAARRGAIFAALRSNAAAAARVTGRVSWPSTRRAAAPRRARRAAVLRGGVKRLAPGRRTLFRLALPRALRQRLATLPPRAVLRARLRIRVRPETGAPTEWSATVPLRGRARP